ncbi:hypothetical protein C4578_00495 [Candidatus Microgenomates bacterium]|jgi:hypothetical protein|nr:MAG: hypothetical protein C4578_00495 [Candidatus Microgenomates bacterium]
METKLLKKEKTLLRLLAVNFSLILLGTFFILIKNESLPEKVPLFYSRPWGEEQLTLSRYLFLIPSISFILFFVNLELSLTFIKRGEKFMAFLSNGFALLFSSLGFITLLRIIFLIT